MIVNLAGVVILYNPEHDCIDNIKTYAKVTGRLYVMDNSGKTNEALISAIKEIPQVVYYSDGKNSGIAVRLNQAAELALKDGFTLLLTMDQDSYFTDSNLSAYIQCLSKFEDSSKVAMYGVEYETPPETAGLCVYRDVDACITSGSVINLKLFSQVGGFNELLFIDEVDTEYCYKAILAGFRIIKFHSIYLQHNLGISRYYWSFKKFTRIPRAFHSPARLYYMVRNHLYMVDKFRDNFKEDLRLRRKALNVRIKNNLIYGNSRLRLVLNLFQAFTDFKNNRMGQKWFN